MFEKLNSRIMFMAATALFLPPLAHAEEPKQKVAQADVFGGFDPMTLESSGVKSYSDLCPYFPMPDLQVPQFPERDFPITDFGATADNTEVAVTEAIAKAITAASEAGGGRVVIPAGKWTTGPIHLKSNINLHIADDAVVTFSDDRSQYLPVVYTRWEGMECYNYSPPIYANGQENIALTGKGKLLGNGEAWWDWKKSRQPEASKALYEMIQKGVPTEDRIMGDKIEGLRPNFVQFINCKNVLIENLTFTNGPMWTLHPIYCDTMIVRGVKVITEGPNNDGINPDSTRNLLIEDCYFSTGDDCVVLKSGLNEDGWRVGKPTENVVIRNVYGNDGHGGIVMGSEMSGGIRNVYAHDCYFVGTDRGIRLKSMRGRGAYIEKLYCERIKMSAIKKEAIHLNSFYQSSTLEPATVEPPVFRDMMFKDITCNGTPRAIEIIGLPESLTTNLTFENIKMHAKKGFVATDAKGISLDNVEISVEDGVAFEFKDTQDVAMTNVSDGSGKKVVPKISGERSENIK